MSVILAVWNSAGGVTGIYGHKFEASLSFGIVILECLELTERFECLPCIDSLEVFLEVTGIDGQ